jgi:16S rRNA (adenine1518-N6/adenine1519-N6)-dimethyltransferase
MPASLEPNTRPAPPKKWLGQHFLHDLGVRRRIVESLGADENDRVMEIGPGRGALTGLLTDLKMRSLVALERDLDLAARIKAEHPLVQVIGCDALQFPWERLGRSGGWRLIGNLPYNVASPLMWEIFSRASGWSRAVFMVQKEVGKRLAARPGGKSYGALSVWVQSFTQVEPLFTVGPGAFSPPPKVESMVLGFEPLHGVEDVAQGALADLLHLVFSKRRKQLGTILKGYWDNTVEDWFHEQGLDRKARPEVLSPNQFKSLARLVFKVFGP